MNNTMHACYSGFSFLPSSSSNINQITRVLVKNPPLRLLCSICQEVFHDPRITACGHSFCNDCITTWKKKNSNCPVCRTNITASLSKNSFMGEILEEMKVHCKFGVKVSKDSDDCRFLVLGENCREISPGCKVTLMLKDITAHEQSCSFNSGGTGSSAHLQEKIKDLKEEVNALKQQGARDRSQIAILKGRESQLEESNQQLLSQLNQVKEDLRRAKAPKVRRIWVRENYDYREEDAEELAEFLKQNKHGSDDFDYSRLFISLQRLATTTSFCHNQDMHDVFYAAKKCTFWTEKQEYKIDSWFDEFSMPSYY